MEIAKHKSDLTPL